MSRAKGQNAQTALELAVFGSILIFVMGTIISSSLSRGNQVHAMLRATRMALAMSHETTETKLISGRNSASVLIVEDRLSAGSSKYGSLDRAPLMAQGSGTHTANMYMPGDFGDPEDLPVFDLFVNGKHFAFSVAAYKTITLAECSPISGLCSPGSYVSNCQEAYASRGQTFVPSMYWDNTCLGVQTKTTRMLLCNTAPGSCPQDCISCDANDTGFYLNTTTALTRTVGCAKLYTIVSNHPLIPEWCDDVDRDCLTDNPYIAGYDPSVDPCQWTSADEPGCNLSASERFDLDRNGVPDVTTNREKFAWQWFLVMGVDETKDTQRAQDTADSLNSGSEDSLSSEIPILLRAEGVVLPGGEQEAKNISLDFDCDLKLENIVANTENESPNKVSESGILLEVGVMDMQEGDIDTTYDDSDKARGIDMYGLTKDVNLYSFVKGDGPNGGTYFQIEEGKLFDNDRQFIRTTSKKDQVDLIERVWRLSNNTGGYCTKDIPPEPTSNAHVKEAYGLDVNPVEACAYAGGCHSGSTIHLTCMDVDNNLLFIRSRIEDLHGRKWVTDVTDDPHFDFQ